MNIKSLILGSAAALVAGGAAQAADLPVAEPVDYVKVCDAYGAGYFFLPGTDTCLKISGYVRTEARFSEAESRADEKFDIWARGQVNFDAKEETELGTLSSRVRIEGEDDGDISIAKAWLSLGGFYAGFLSSAGIVDYVGDVYGGDYDLGDTDVPQMGYNMAFGNGVTATLGIANNKHLIGDKSVGLATVDYAGQSLPTLVARLKVDQAWGSVAVGGIVSQARYGWAQFDNDVAYSVSAGGIFNLDMLSAGSEFALNGFYTKGAMAWNGINDASVMSDATYDASTGEFELNELYGVSASLKYAFADNLWAIVAGGYGEYDDQGASEDFDQWTASAELGYKPVKNLKVVAGIQYTDRDFEAAASTADYDTWEGKLRLQRNF
ncbi:Porin subfamily protein [Cohaesibacter marisflavi]|uniref:Porin n=1 Tax=Cohaesibacter marisflavi TaxID=655353 RepID=A0A1I5C5J6_9HYPH|nr:porin [Cohaesibacter marisflavi]SFN82207.1 Porin subfamily protein [Cohaesibacter marisflavi]